MPLLGDLRFALRVLARSPAYALTSIAVLALGIGADVAIFSVLYSVVLAPLPYPDASRLVFVWQKLVVLADPIIGPTTAYHENYVEWRKQNTVFDDMAAFGERTLVEKGSDHPQKVSVGFASANLFSLLGVRARLGRAFAPGEESAGKNQVAVIADKFFEHRFHRDARILGQTLTLNGNIYTIIGILPPRFHLPATHEGLDRLAPEIWIPLSRLWSNTQKETVANVYVPARLKRGVSLTRARTEMAGIAERLAEADPKLNKPWTATVSPFQVEDTAPILHRALWVLAGAVGFLLLIACANLANLTLARATQRTREMAVRLALGATRAQIVRHMLAESLVVSLIGTFAGLLLGYWCLKLILALKPPDVQRPELIGLNFAVFAFAAGLTLITTLMFGLIPALIASRGDVNCTLKSGGGWGGSAVRLRGRQFLIGSEIALALMLLTGAGLMIRSFQELVKTGIGFPTGHLVTADVELPARDFTNAAGPALFFRRLLDRVGRIPGVVSAGLIDNLPLHQVSMRQYLIAGRPEPRPDAVPVFDTAAASPNYFDVIGLRLLAGRPFSEGDLTRADNDRVAIINQSMARQVFAGENPIGQRLLEGNRSRSYTIVGVASDYRALGVENPTRPEVFQPSLQMDKASLIVRTNRPLDPLAKEIQQAIWSLDRGIPETKVLTMDYYLDEWQSQRKFNTLLLGTFAGLALVLAMIGIYGVLANLATSRVREIGIRMAIGAAPAEIGRLILRQSFIPISIGLVAGLAGTLALGRFIEALLFHVRPRDPWTLALAVAAILLASPLALFVPLRRATHVDCTVALREE
jgi:putative ABC transport system permease protein